MTAGFFGSGRTGLGRTQNKISIPLSGGASAPALSISQILYVIGGHPHWENVLDWTASVGSAVSAYNVFLSINGGATTLLASEPSSTLAYNDAYLASTATLGSYAYYVQAVTSGGDVNSNTDTVAFPIGSPLVSITSGDNSTGPYQFHNENSGEGFYDGLTSGGPSCGSATPSPPDINGFACSVLATDYGGNGNFFTVAVYGTVAQNLFNSVSFTDNLSVVETFQTASANFQNMIIDGVAFSIWQWMTSNANPFNNGTTYPITIT